MKNQINIKEGAKSSLFFLSFKNISLSFSNKQIFSDLTFNIYYNNILLIKGPVGAGKSTFLKILANVIAPQKGCFRHEKNGIPVEGIYVHSQAEFNFITGYVNDEILLSGADAELLKEFSGRSVYDLSGGELKRLSVMIAASAFKDYVLLLDEPLDMLDDIQSQKMFSFILEHSKTRPFIIVTHDDCFDKVADAVIEIGK